ncbi:MAG: hypothetical protein AAGB34_09615 [Planctomycetota bacterium]
MLGEYDPERGGYRFGPFLFVPGIKAKDDEWKHRRGEPRVFALLWTGFVLFAAAATLFVVNGAGYTRHEIQEVAVRSLLLVILAGIVLVYPAIRLSQAPDPHPVRAGLLDAVVVLMPLVPLLLLCPMLASWPGDVAFVLWITILGWVMLITGLVTLAIVAGTIVDRVWAMLACIALGIGTLAIVVALHGKPIDQAALSTMSPFTVIWSVTDSPGNLMPRAESGHLIAMWWPGVLGSALMAASGMANQKQRPAVDEARSRP